MDNKERHNKALDDLQEYKNYLRDIILGLKNLDEKSEFMRKWNENAIKDREYEIETVNKIIKNLIRF